MLFQYTWQLVIEGRKTETRRIVQPGDRTATPPYDHAGSYRVGQIVPVMPSRGVKGIRKVADIRITAIDRQDCRNIRTSDARREGYASDLEFLATWCAIHDPLGFEYICEFGKQPESKVGFVRALEQQPNLIEFLGGRPKRLYDCWVITFDVIQIYEDAVATARALINTGG